MFVLSLGPSRFVPSRFDPSRFVPSGFDFLRIALAAAEVTRLDGEDFGGAGFGVTLCGGTGFGITGSMETRGLADATGACGALRRWRRLLMFQMVMGKASGGTHRETVTTANPRSVETITAAAGSMCVGIVDVETLPFDGVVETDSGILEIRAAEFVNNEAERACRGGNVADDVMLRDLVVEVQRVPEP